MTELETVGMCILIIVYGCVFYMAGRKYEQDRSKVHKQSINFAVSQKEKDRIIQEAETMGMSMSGYIRYRLFIKEAK